MLLWFRKVFSSFSEPTSRIDVGPLNTLYIAFKRRWPMFVIVFVLFFMTVVIVTFRSPKIYRAAAIIEIGTEIPDVAFFKEVVSVNPTNWWSIGRYYETQYKIIKSRSLLGKASERLIANKVWPAKKGVKDKDAYVSRLKGGVSVTPVGDSRLVELGFTDTDMAHVADVANTVAEVYQEENLNRKLVSAKKAVTWLTQQMSEFQKEKNAYDEQLQLFKEKHRIVSTANPSQIIEDNLEGLANTLNASVQERIKLEARYLRLNSMVKESKKVEDLFGIVENDLLKKLKTEYVDQERKYLVLSVRYKSKHPEIIRAKKELEQLKSKIDLEVKNEVQRLKSRYLLAQAEEERVRQELEEKKLQALELERVNFELENIRTVADTNQKFFLALNEKLKEADLSGLVKSNNIRVIDAALPASRPIAPNVKMNLILGLTIALIFGLAAVMLIEYLDGTFKNQADIERILPEIAVLGFVPEVTQKIKEAENGSEVEPQEIEHVPIVKPSSTVAELYRNIRTNLAFVTSRSHEKVLLLTSSGPREGKTVTSSNLATTLAQMGQRVLLVDADLRRPSIHQVFDLKNTKGFSSVLIESATFEEAVQSTKIANLDIVTSGPIPPNPSELLQSKILDTFLNSMSAKYDKVILDACPALIISDVLSLVDRVDGVIFLIRAEKPHRIVVQRAIKQLKQVGANIVGIVLNGVHPDQLDLADRYYRQYGYYHYRSHEASGEEHQTSL